jgi:hypothetical protein
MDTGFSGSRIKAQFSTNRQCDIAGPAILVRWHELGLYFETRMCLLAAYLYLFVEHPFRLSRKFLRAFYDQKLRSRKRKKNVDFEILKIAF